MGFINRALLVLEDGTIFEGKGFGSSIKVSGEVVFNTGMVGYTEAITDPSYYGQILCQTYPLIGNYGISKKDFESAKPKITGYIISELCNQPSHYSAELSLNDWLKENNIPGIEGIDTRELTKRLRIKGTMLGILQTGNGINKEKLLEEVKKVQDPNKRDLVCEVTIKEPIIYENKGPKIAVIDCGCKENIIRNLLKRKANVIRVPANFNADKILSYKPNGILISNGPGDPKKVPYLIETIKKLIEYKIPIMGICLGNQVLALALGCDTYKLKFGHRGQNHPAIDLKSNRCHITSQNHGYAISKESVKDKVEITYLNANDGTVEGIKHKSLPLFGTQFHPEVSPGPYDTDFLFDNFFKMVRKCQS